MGHGNNHFFTLAQEGAWEEFAREARALAARFSQTDMAQPFEVVAGSVTGLFNIYGLPVIRAQAARKQWWRFFQSLVGAHRHLGVDWRVLLRRFRRLLVVPQWVLARQRTGKQYRYLVDVGRDMVDPEFAARIGLDERLDYYRSDASEHMLEYHLGEREQQLQTLGGARRRVILGTTNQVGAMFGIELAHPFMDRRLIEFCLALPPNLSLRDGWTRYIMRSALRDVLPESVQLRLGKADMMQNYVVGLTKRDGALFLERLANLGLVERYVDRDRVAQYKQVVEAADPTQHSKERTHLARLVTLSTLLDKRFGQRQASGVEEVGAPQTSAG